MRGIPQITRRDWLTGAAAATLGSGLGRLASAEETPSVKPKTVAAVVTAYAHNLHADVLLGKILEGWEQDGGPGPALRLVSMYVEQVGEKDMSRRMSEKYNVPIFDTIEKAVTVGTNTIPVDGVISIAEHGSYPTNDLGQVLYPRKRFFEEITDTFKKYGRVVAVFNDKHLGPPWADAKWMYDRAQQMQVPLMAGSSLALTYRDPDVSLPMNCEIESAVGIGYSHLDIYGFHAMDSFQSFVERRKGAETGVKWVQCLQGKQIWEPLSSGLISRHVFDAALSLVAREPKRIGDSDNYALFLFEYLDGLVGAVFMLPGFATNTAISVKLKGQYVPVTTRFEERPVPRHPHFAYLLKGIERMIHTGRPSYPVERTLLAGGILDRALTSRRQNHARLMTPELAIRYQPADYPHAPYPDLHSDPSRPVPHRD